VTLVGPQVGEKTRKSLRGYGSTVVESNSTLLLRNLFHLTDYSQVAYLEANAFLSNPKADDLFKECHSADICALPKQQGDHVLEVETDIMVMRPSIDVFERVLLEKDGGEQGVIPPFLQQRFQPLESKYDTCFDEYIDQCLKESHSASVDDSLEFVECVNRYTQEKSIVSSDCSAYNYLHEPLCVWWETTSPKCEIESFRAFQEDLVQINECALSGQSRESCESDEWDNKCQWCGQQSRCIPSNEECHEDMTESQRSADKEQHSDIESLGGVNESEGYVTVSNA